jgi:hypothetical protein
MHLQWLARAARRNCATESRALVGLGENQWQEEILEALALLGREPLKLHTHAVTVGDAEHSRRGYKRRIRHQIDRNVSERPDWERCGAPHKSSTDAEIERRTRNLPRIRFNGNPARHLDTPESPVFPAGWNRAWREADEVCRGDPLACRERSWRPPQTRARATRDRPRR